VVKIFDFGVFGTTVIICLGILRNNC